MVNENLIPKTETVYELKNEIPTYEEFMKNYQNDGNLSYADLNSWNIGTPKGYGPVFFDKYDQKMAREIVSQIAEGNRKKIERICDNCKKDGKWKIDSGEWFCDEHYEDYKGKVRFAKWMGKTALSVGASTLLGPVGAFAVGGTLWGANKTAELITGEKDEVASAIGDFGGGLALGEAVGFGVQKLAGGVTSLLGGDVDRVRKATDGALTYDWPTGELTAHETHKANGINYEPNCPVCK